MGDHRVCIAQEHDPANGKLHGGCVICQELWPCPTELAANGPKSSTLRDEFAMAALTGLCADPQLDIEQGAMGDLCYQIADKMLQARKETPDVPS